MFTPNKAIKNAQSELKILSWVLDVKLETNDISQQQKVRPCTCGSMAWLKRRILHAPNQILILVDSNKYVRLI